VIGIEAGVRGTESDRTVDDTVQHDGQDGVREPTGSGDDGEVDRMLTLPNPVADTAAHEAEPPPAGGGADWDTAAQWELQQQTLALEVGAYTDTVVLEMAALGVGVRAALAAARMHMDAPLPAPGVHTALEAGVHADGAARGLTDVPNTAAHVRYAAHSVRPDCLAGMEPLFTRAAEPPPPSRTQQGCVGE
jgi:hypothetical protein